MLRFEWLILVRKDIAVDIILLFVLVVFFLRFIFKIFSLNLTRHESRERVVGNHTPAVAFSI